jgi:hypothetical protein
MSIQLMWSIFVREYARMHRWLTQYMSSENAHFITVGAFANLETYVYNGIETPYGPLQQLYYHAHRNATTTSNQGGYFVPSGALRSIPLPDELEVGQFTQLYLELMWAYRLCEVDYQGSMILSAGFFTAQRKDLRKVDPKIIFESTDELSHLLARLVASLRFKDNALPKLKSDMNRFEVREMQRSMAWLVHQRMKSVPLRNERKQQDHSTRQPR